MLYSISTRLTMNRLDIILLIAVAFAMFAFTPSEAEGILNF